MSGVKRSRWIQGLLKKGLIPVIEELDTCKDKNKLANLEIYWISQFKSWGFRLLNMTDGGDSSIGYKHTEETKNKISEKHKGKRVGKDNFFYGRKHSQETKDLISKAKLGSKWKEERKEAFSNKLIGRKRPKEVIKKIAKSNYKEVKRYDLEGNLEKVYSSIKSVKEDGFGYTRVITACTSGKKYRNKIWKRTSKSSV